MSRVKRGTTSLKHRKNVLRQVKGYRFGRSNKERMAKDAIMHAGAHAFAHRKTKKREYRALWTLRINAAAREAGFTYSTLMDTLKKANIGIDRKTLSALAKDYPEAFTRLVKGLKA